MVDLTFRKKIPSPSSDCLLILVLAHHHVGTVRSDKLESHFLGWLLDQSLANSPTKSWQWHLVTETHDVRADLMDRRRNAVAAILYDGIGRHSLGDGHLRLFGCLCLQGRTERMRFRARLCGYPFKSQRLLYYHIYITHICILWYMFPYIKWHFMIHCSCHLKFPPRCKWGLGFSRSLPSADNYRRFGTSLLDSLSRVKQSRGPLDCLTF